MAPGRRRHRKVFWRPKEVEQPQRGHLRPSRVSADEAEADPATEQEKTFRLTMRSAVSGDFLGVPGGGDFSKLEWDAKATTVRKMREAVASAVLATWKAEGAERSRPNRLHWENILLWVPEVRPPPPPSAFSQPEPPAAQEDNSSQEAENQPEPTSRDSVKSVCNEDYCFDMDVLPLEDDEGKALLYDALHACGAREVEADTEMANAGVAFEVKYFVRTFEPFASKKDAQKALALSLLEEAACRWMAAVGEAGPGLTGAVAAQCDALYLEQKDIAEKYGPVRIWDLSLVSDFSWLVSQCGDVAFDEGFGKRFPDLLQRVLPLGIRSAWLPFNSDISGWDVSGATDLSCMFHDCEKFNCDIGTWDVSKVESFANMFFGCREFDQNLAAWNVGNGVDFSCMFRNCEKFDQDLGAWNVGNGVNFSRMFALCQKFDQNLAAWNVGNGVEFSGMFTCCRRFNQDLYELSSHQVGRSF
eukprot:g20220.t1